MVKGVLASTGQKLSPAAQRSMINTLLRGSNYFVLNCVVVPADRPSKMTGIWHTSSPRFLKMNEGLWEKLIEPNYFLFTVEIFAHAVSSCSSAEASILLEGCGSSHGMRVQVIGGPFRHLPAVQEGFRQSNQLVCFDFWKQWSKYSVVVP